MQPYTYLRTLARRAIPWFLVSFLLMPLAIPASAQHCGPTEAIHTELTDQYGEQIGRASCRERVSLLV